MATKAYTLDAILLQDESLHHPRLGRSSIDEFHVSTRTSCRFTLPGDDLDRQLDHAEPFHTEYRRTVRRVGPNYHEIYHLPVVTELAHLLPVGGLKLLAKPLTNN
ncbi:hypothetical protein EVAR_81253_1 [Eumeta japonica]|uniref:Uncharacterized protein n=1 Tax=Eumeta variegata TaxID=151549 RepID=A0A4C1WVJ7_EUMVA|nr:hypothetical protein EVAR_81253_1 [Eumeta japonica]